MNVSSISDQALLQDDLNKLCHWAISVRLESRLTVVSREAKKKQHACASSGPRDHYSELFTRMAALKF